MDKLKNITLDNVIKVVIAPNLFSDNGEQNVFLYIMGDDFPKRLSYKNVDEVQPIYNYFRDRGFNARDSGPMVILEKP